MVFRLRMLGFGLLIWVLLHELTELYSQLVYVVLNIAGSDQRQDDLFSNESFLAMGRSALKGLKVRWSVGIDSVADISNY